jgi:hypothetical protein
MRIASVPVSFFIIGSQLDVGLSRPSHQLDRKVFILNAFPRLSMK